MATPKDIIAGANGAAGSPGGEFVFDMDKPQEIQTFLATLSEELARRNERIAELEREVHAARANGAVAAPAASSGGAREVGEAVAKILEAAEVAAQQTRVRALEAHEDLRRKVDGVVEALGRAQQALGAIAHEVATSVGEPPAEPGPVPAATAVDVPVAEEPAPAPTPANHPRRRATDKLDPQTQQAVAEGVVRFNTRADAQGAPLISELG